VKLLGAAPGFSTGAAGVVEGAPNENRLFAGVEGGAGAVVTDSLVDWPKEKGAVGAGLEFSVTDAVAGKDADVKAGLEIGRAGFRACSASAGAGVVALGNEKAWVVTPVDCVSGFGLGTGTAGDEDPNPRNEFIAPPKSGFCGAGLASFFSVGCDVEEGVRLNGSELVLLDCVDEVGID
jgi:hypothetical protein